MVADARVLAEVLGHHFERHGEDGAVADLWRHDHFAAHLFHNRLADGEAEAAPRWVQLCILGKVSEVYEQIIYFLVWDATAEILNRQLELYVSRSALLQFRLLHKNVVQSVVAECLQMQENLGVLWRKLNTIRQEVD